MSTTSSLADEIAERTGARLISGVSQYGRDNDICAVAVERDGETFAVAVSFADLRRSGVEPDLGDAICSAINARLPQRSAGPPPWVIRDGAHVCDHRADL